MAQLKGGRSARLRDVGRHPAIQLPFLYEATVSQDLWLHFFVVQDSSTFVSKASSLLRTSDVGIRIKVDHLAVKYDDLLDKKDAALEVARKAGGPGDTPPDKVNAVWVTYSNDEKPLPDVLTSDLALYSRRPEFLAAFLTPTQGAWDLLARQSMVPSFGACLLHILLGTESQTFTVTESAVKETDYTFQWNATTTALTVPKVTTLKNIKRVTVGPAQQWEFGYDINTRYITYTKGTQVTAPTSLSVAAGADLILARRPQDVVAPPKYYWYLPTRGNFLATRADSGAAGVLFITGRTDGGRFVNGYAVLKPPTLAQAAYYYTQHGDGWLTKFTENLGQTFESLRDSAAEAASTDTFLNAGLGSGSVTQTYVACFNKYAALNPFEYSGQDAKTFRISDPELRILTENPIRYSHVITKNQYDNISRNVNAFDPANAFVKVDVEIEGEKLSDATVSEWEKDSGTTYTDQIDKQRALRDVLYDNQSFRVQVLNTLDALVDSNRALDSDKWGWLVAYWRWNRTLQVAAPCLGTVAKQRPPSVLPAPSGPLLPTQAPVVTQPSTARRRLSDVLKTGPPTGVPSATPAESTKLGPVNPPQQPQAPPTPAQPQPPPPTQPLTQQTKQPQAPPAPTQPQPPTQPLTQPPEQPQAPPAPTQPQPPPPPTQPLTQQPKQPQAPPAPTRPQAQPPPTQSQSQPLPQPQAPPATQSQALSQTQPGSLASVQPPLDLRPHLQAAQEKTKQLQTALEESEEARIRQQRELTSLRQELNALKVSGFTKAGYEAQIDSLTAQVQELTAQTASQRIQINTLSEEVAQFVSGQQQKEQTIAALSAELDTVRQEKNTAQTELAALNALAELRISTPPSTDVVELQGKAKSLEVENVRLQKSLGDTTTRLNIVEQNRAAAETAMAQLQATLSEREQQILQGNGLVAQLNAQIAALKAQQPGSPMKVDSPVSPMVVSPQTPPSANSPGGPSALQQLQQQVRDLQQQLIQSNVDKFQLQQARVDGGAVAAVAQTAQAAQAAQAANVSQAVTPLPPAGLSSKPSAVIQQESALLKQQLAEANALQKRSDEAARERDRELVKTATQHQRALEKLRNGLEKASSYLQSALANTAVSEAKNSLLKVQRQLTALSTALKSDAAALSASLQNLDAASTSEIAIIPGSPLWTLIALCPTALRVFRYAATLCSKQAAFQALPLRAHLVALQDAVGSLQPLSAAVTRLRDVILPGLETYLAQQGSATLRRFELTQPQQETVKDVIAALEDLLIQTFDQSQFGRGKLENVSAQVQQLVTELLAADTTQQETLSSLAAGAAQARILELDPANSPLIAEAPVVHQFVAWLVEFSYATTYPALQSKINAVYSTSNSLTTALQNMAFQFETQWQIGASQWGALRTVLIDAFADMDPPTFFRDEGGAYTPAFTEAMERLGTMSADGAAVQKLLQTAAVFQAMDQVYRLWVPAGNVATLSDLFNNAPLFEWILCAAFVELAQKLRGSGWNINPPRFFVPAKWRSVLERITGQVPESVQRLPL